MGSENLEPLLLTLINNKGSDLHLIPGHKPSIRIDGELYPLEYPTLTGKMIETLCMPYLDNKDLEKLKKGVEVDGVAILEGKGRFRFNIYLSMGEMAAAFRLIPIKIPRLNELFAPEVFAKLMEHQRGLILVTGPTGSGKSTTLAAMLHEANLTQSRHIITVEDPVEFFHNPIKCNISHRQVERDTENFATALKYALRQDPDIILVGEMRDKETISAALTAAETGHLVLSTLHTNSAPRTIHRIVDSFNAEEQNQVRAMLADSLIAVIAQSLLPKIGGGRTAVWEIMITNNAIANLIREGKIHQIYSTMQLGRGESQMQTQSENLARLIREGVIDVKTAFKYALYPEELKTLIPPHLYNGIA
ncbi:MAG: PilT/PilU family type 4a pilus ATPase [Epsilonproteobacteria bacterium]|nr:PilT/PilU family type 4a pilus ATPase [Campylobacterota bacterium]